MAELEIDLNQKLGEWETCQESSNTLIPVYGPGRTGSFICFFSPDHQLVCNFI